VKVLYDHQIFAAQRYGGISRYFCELFQYYHKSGCLQFDLSVPCHNNSILKNAQFNHHSAIGKLMQIMVGIGLANKERVNVRASTTLLKKGRYDVFHPTYYDPYFVPFLGRMPYVLTVYDLTQEIYPGSSPLHDHFCETKKSLARGASAVIAISEATKKDIVKFYEIDADRIHVIHLASSFRTDSRAGKTNSASRLPEQFLLFLGKRHGYKNFSLLVSAMARISSKDDKLKVVCAGALPFTDEELTTMKELNIQDRFVHMKASDEVLEVLYRRAAAFVFPSLNEGFGLPILEAFSCGCPVICSNTSSLPEIGGDAAEYFDPTNTASLVDAIERVIYDKNKRDTLVEKGFCRNAMFSWEKTALQTLKVYESVSLRSARSL